MILEKELLSPRFNRRSVRRTLSLFGEKRGAIFAEGLHFRDNGRELVCAEGARSLGPTKTLILSQGHAEEEFEYRGGALVSPAGESYPVPALPNALFCFVPKEGGKEYFALTESGCYRLKKEGAEKVGEGGVCGAVHGERLFLGNGSRLSWSAPLDPADATEGARLAGHTDLPSADGEILAAISFEDELYLFREGGIARLGVRGDPLAFTAVHLPVPSGIVKGSVRKCGGKVFFLTQDGLYAFDGKKCSLAGTFPEGLELAETDPAVCGKKYFAAATYRGEKCIWCAEDGRGRLIRARAEKLFGGKKAKLIAEGELFELTERGLPPMRRRECVLRTEPTALGLSPRNKYLDGILIEGRGHFRVEAKGERGLPRAVFGAAGKRLAFPLPVRGSEFSLEIKTIDEDARIRAVVFDVREEAAVW